MLVALVQKVALHGQKLVKVVQPALNLARQPNAKCDAEHRKAQERGVEQEGDVRGAQGVLIHMDNLDL